MLLVNRMAGSAQGVLEVPQHGVDPLEALQFHAFAASASDHGSVPAACVNHAGETAQSVGDDLAAPGDTLSNAAGDFGLRQPLTRRSCIRTGFSSRVSTAAKKGILFSGPRGC